MLTAIPPRVLHWLRDRAREVLALAELGLALTCPCGGDHGTGPALLGHDEPADRCCPPGYLHRAPCRMAGLQLGGAQ